MIPDVEVSSMIDIELRLGFPLATRTVNTPDYVLTKEDFDPDNSADLLRRLGIPTQEISGNIPEKISEVYQTIISRYLGPHSTVPNKTPAEAFSFGMAAMNKGIDTIESAMKAEEEQHHEVEVESFKLTISKNALMMNIKSAIENNGYKKLFEKKHPKIQVQELSIEPSSSKFYVKHRSGHYPIYSKTLALQLITFIDRQQTFHQGSEPILKFLEGVDKKGKKKKEKESKAGECKEDKKKDGEILFFDENGEPIEKRELVESHVANCKDCQFVSQIKSVNKVEGRNVKIKEEDIPKVIAYSDKYHLGFREAFRQISTWCDFPDFEDKVYKFKFYFITNFHPFRFASTLLIVICASRTKPGFFCLQIR